MKSALIGLDPTLKKGTTFESFSRIVNLFQKKGFFPHTMVAAVLHHNLFSMPLEFYRDMKEELAKEGHDSLKSLIGKKFQMESIKILQSHSQFNEDHISELCKYGTKKKADVIILSSTEDHGLSHWILGSFCETASLSSTLPILIVKPYLRPSQFSSKVSYIVAVDVEEPITEKALKWIADSAHITSASIELIYVKPQGDKWYSRLVKRSTPKNNPQEVLKSLQLSLQMKGVKAKVTILKENISVAHTIVEHAEKNKVWMIITTNKKRSRPHRILMGSNSRRILLMTKRPFLNLRF